MTLPLPAPHPHRPRLAVRALIVEEDRLLLVNAYPDLRLDLWCAPGGGVEPHQSLPENLARELFEETGLTIEVGPLALVNEFHDPDSGFHQVEMFFRCKVIDGTVSDDWIDTDTVVTKRGWFTRDDVEAMHVLPESLARVAFEPTEAAEYDPLTILVK